MKGLKSIIFVTMFSVVLFFALSANATLVILGTDTLGNRLIYDDDLDITWYDYTNPYDYWQNQLDWASNLTVEFGGIIYDDWRLPTCNELLVYLYDIENDDIVNIKGEDKIVVIVKRVKTYQRE